MATLVPYLTFTDGDASLAFLRDVFGFEASIEQRDDDGALVHVELKRGDAMVMGGPGEATMGTAPGLYLVVDDVSSTYERALASGARSVYPPEQTDWGTWRARLTDPDGHEWTVGTYQPGQEW